MTSRERSTNHTGARIAHIGAVLLLGAVCTFSLSQLAHSGSSTTTAASTTATGDEAPPEFTEEFMNNMDNIELGKGIWKKRCKFCHGNSAYPGKAPKLKPKRYEPAFVYKRITKGFRGMPGWSHEFDQHERMATTAYIMHKSFSQK